MNSAIEPPTKTLAKEIPYFQYDDSVRRRTSIPGEYRLLQAVLEDGIRTYAANRSCSNVAQRRTFEEVRDWFEPKYTEAGALFDFQNVCDLLRIDSDRLLKALKSLDVRSLSLKRFRVLPTAATERLAA
jgi:hypothetical protein